MCNSCEFSWLMLENRGFLPKVTGGKCATTAKDYVMKFSDVNLSLFIACFSEFYMEILKIDQQIFILFPIFLDFSQINTDQLSLYFIATVFYIHWLANRIPYNYNST